MNKDRVLADMHKQMSDARSHLMRGLWECTAAHETDVDATCPDVQSRGTTCSCRGCTIRKSIELALDDLEVDA